MARDVLPSKRPINRGRPSRNDAECMRPVSSVGRLYGGPTILRATLKYSVGAKKSGTQSRFRIFLGWLPGGQGRLEPQHIARMA